MIKQNKSVPYEELYSIEDTNRVTVEAAWNRLVSDYGLIRSRQQVFTLTEKGEIHKSVKDYLNSLKPKRDYAKWIAIVVSVALGGINIYQNYDYRELRSQYDILKSELDACRDSLSQPKSIKGADTEPPLRPKAQNKD
ncbi:hypothetical protein J0X14_18870 [Muricauda sp. CAU 1633]|uniref:hypothetical protein n=1 Tax=Allomuricauda sp. CAU 1633 TaxID=2816036 RepID=UPI001A903BC9|nr:hypothetical protein [Muricauda sp. CAU 1633]MBO0324378.1 hypothetical protein [Muricauda sp. CAU 1633]